MKLPFLRIGTWTETDLLDGDRDRYGEGYFRQLHAASTVDRPALVFVPGFFTDLSPRTARGGGFGYDPALSRLAKARDLDTWVLHWPSEYLLGALVDTTKLERVLHKAAKALPVPFGLLKGPLLSWLEGPLLLEMLSKAHRAWDRAIERAEHTGRSWRSWAGGLDRPLYLAGHSLGARIVLKAAEHAPERTFHRLVAMATAAHPRHVDGAAVARALHRRPTMIYSARDLALQTWFRMAERSPGTALGISVPDALRAHFDAVDASPHGHADYKDVLEGLLSPLLHEDELG